MTVLLVQGLCFENVCSALGPLFYKWKSKAQKCWVTCSKSHAQLLTGFHKMWLNLWSSLFCSTAIFWGQITKHGILPMCKLFEVVVLFLSWATTIRSVRVELGCRIKSSALIFGPLAGRAGSARRNREGRRRFLSQSCYRVTHTWWQLRILEYKEIVVM